jgi:hypothetical protein
MCKESKVQRNTPTVGPLVYKLPVIHRKPLTCRQLSFISISTHFFFPSAWAQMQAFHTDVVMLHTCKQAQATNCRECLMRLKTQNYKNSIEWESMYSQLQIFYVVTNFCITIKGLEIMNSYHVLCHELQSISNETQNYKISIECKTSIQSITNFPFCYKLRNS